MYDLSVPAADELGSTVRRRLVGDALRKYREHLGYGLADAANVLECDRSKISRIETGQRGIRAKDLRELLTEYGVSTREQRTLTALADPRSAQRGWWHDYADIVPAGHQDLMIMETLASEILVYDAQQIPDLLQTPDYARAVAESDPDSKTPEPSTLNRLAEMSLTRQQVIMTERRTPVTAIIGQATLLCRPEDNPGLMRDQMHALIQLSHTCPQVTLQVLPFWSGIHPQSPGPMSILRFAEAPGLGVVHLRGPDGGVCLTGQAALASHLRAFTHLQAAALPPQQSAQMLGELAQDI
jgi:transcriptional regulator with XRE-family HTH domain